mgnify:FL=1|tara:strand:- start:135 stop:1091 length:957 start_codon:yes stop_codon:yes gene_type:complete
MLILVTGAAGFIGSHTVERLIAMGHEIQAIDNFSPYYDIQLKKLNAKALQEKGVVVENVDLRNDQLSKKIAKGVNCVIHFAAQPGIATTSNFEDYFSNNVIATQRLLDLFESHEKKPFFINISTSSIYGEYATMTEDQAPMPVSLYGVTKLTAEQLVLSASRNKHLKSTSLRLYSVYGPRERPDKLFTRIIDCGLNNKAFPLYKGSEKHLRSFTYVGDIVDGIVSTIDKEAICNGEIFNLGIDEENTTAKGIATVEEILGKKITLETMPIRPGEQFRTKANIDKARKLLNYNPKTTLKEGLKLQVDWFRETFMNNLTL